MQSTSVRILNVEPRWVIVVSVTALVGLVLLAATSAQGRGNQRLKDVAATIGDQTITVAELDSLAKDRLVKVRNDEYTIRTQVLEERLSALLMEAEARKRQVTVEALTRAEIESKVAPVTKEEARAVLESKGASPVGAVAADALAAVESSLSQGRRSEARKRFVARLRAQANVRTFLEPPRADLDESRGHSRGAHAAPVTIVEYADFQCPYCRSVSPTIRAIREKYGDKVRFVFRHLPLPNHKDAAKAAEASECAGEQGRFWEMHDRLFENASGLQVPELKRLAAGIGLDAVRFDACLDGGRFGASWQRDRAEAQRLGVTATPTFFINGRMVRGALPLQAFAAVIDEELGRVSSWK